MVHFTDARPEVSVYLFKTISRTTVDGQKAASARYQGKDDYIDLTPFLDDGSAVRTSKSPREPAGGFNIAFADKAQSGAASQKLETIYGLVEPMDGIEIRMWNGVGARPEVLPIKMRGFVSTVTRPQTMGQNGKPIRQVVISGQDFGKIWQMYQVLYLQAYSEGKALLTTYALQELFGIAAKNTMPAAEVVKEAIDKIINPFLKSMLPEHWDALGMPTQIKTDIAVKRGVIGSNSFQNTQGSIYDILRSNTDVPTWNELYIEDREDGVYCVYRPIPALTLLKHEKIQSDAVDPVYVEIEDSIIEGITVERSDANVANFYWVNNTRYDLIDEIQRKLQSIPSSDTKVNSVYPNSSAKYYGTRPMYAETQLSGDNITNVGSGQSKDEIAANQPKVLSWIDQRRKELVEMNKDNVVFERGSARVKGGQMRSRADAMRAGDYARFIQGQMVWDAYVIQMDDDFQPFSSYSQTLSFERGEGFATRIGMESGAWLVEQASRL